MVSNAVSQSFARRLEAEGVTVAEWVFLRVLHDMERCTPSLLAERMGMTKGAVSKLAERLDRKVLIVRRAHPDDRRSQLLALTSTGRALVPKLAGFADQNDASFFFNILTAAERKQLQSLLHKIVSKHHLTTLPID